jgi:tripartite-type tricarboxylate transporter receptor subunit TctC
MMRQLYRPAFLLCAAIASLATEAAFAQASAFPARPVRLILAYPAGSGVDAAIRALANEMSKALGQAVVVDNRPGASGMIGAEACAKAAPDGYSICAIDRGPLSFQPNFHKKLAYDPARDFEPIGNLFNLVQAVVVLPESPAGSIQELIALARGKPGSLNFGSVGNGSPPHLVIEAINKKYQIKMVHIPFTGPPPLIQAILAGDVQTTWLGVGSTLGLIRGKKLKALVQSGPKRSPLLPDVPTFAEAGLGDIDDRMWFGLAGPAGTPKEAVLRYYTEASRIFAIPDFREQRLVGQGWDPALMPPDEFRQFVAGDRAAAGRFIRGLGIEPE